MGTVGNPNGSWVNKEVGEWTFIYPVFKFMEEVHLDRFYATGELYLPTLHEFKDKEKYDGTILDVSEGLFKIRNTYSYTGLIKNTYGLLPRKFPPDQFVKLRDSVMEKEFIETSCLAYCVADSFFSDSLIWAVKHKKNSCLMIIDLHEFVAVVTKYIAPDYTLIHTKPCEYSGRFVDEFNPDEFSLTEVHLTDPNRKLFSKPKTHKDQHEVRAVWRTAGSRIEPVTIAEPHLRDFTLRVLFSTITLDNWNKAKAGVGAVGVFVKQKNGKMGEVIARIPVDVTSPVVFKHKDEWKLGFRYANPSNHIEGGIFHTETFPHYVNGSTLFQVCDFEAIEYIEYFYDANFDQRQAESMKGNHVFATGVLRA
jgi:hypothetical protein